MICFSCPTCKKILRAPKEQTGHKVACPACGQRLQIPAPPRNKTVLGGFVPENDPAAQQAAPQAGNSPKSNGGAPVESAAEATWFYVQEGQKAGPISFAQLQQLAAGFLEPETLVWGPGMADWAAASTVAGLSFSRPAKGKRRKALAWGSVGVATAACGLVAMFVGLRDLTTAHAEPVTRTEKPAAQSPDFGKEKAIQDKKPEDKKPKEKKTEKAHQEPVRPAAVRNRSAVALRLAAAGKEYATHLDKSAKVLEEALKEEDQDPSQALVNFRKQIAGQLQSLAGELNTVRGMLPQLAADPNLPRATLEAMSELCNQCMEMKELLEGKGLARYTPAMYVDKVNALVRAAGELVQKL